ncbi:hypothetical protein ACVOMV_29045 [Mesorhizobium atlanticum]
MFGAMLTAEVLMMAMEASSLAGDAHRAGKVLAVRRPALSSSATLIKVALAASALVPAVWALVKRG